VALHGGDVTAESEGLNKGSVFTVCLPSEVTCLEAESNAGSPVSSPQTDHKAKVMIVDDNLDSGQTMGWLMESLGCEVRVLSSGPAAIEAAPSFVPELVLLDIGMPEMNGYDVCQALQKVPELEDTVFIALTGWGQPEHRKRSKESGFHHHLVKPLDMELFKPILADLKETPKVLPG
jgi:CheY-like chemotaxis protein